MQKGHLPRWPLLISIYCEILRFLRSSERDLHAAVGAYARRSEPLDLLVVLVEEIFDPSEEFGVLRDLV